MNNKFDELTKSMAQSVTRRAALKKFGAGLAGMALACFGLANKARAATYSGYCQIHRGFDPGQPVAYTGLCMDLNRCVGAQSADCPAPGTAVDKKAKAVLGCHGGLFYTYDTSKRCSFSI
jgi:hypothetical protein